MAALRNVCYVRKRNIFSISVLRSHHKSPVNTFFESPLELSRPSLSVRRNIWSTSRIDDFTKALSDAEKLVGYPTSFLNLRYLLSDEISNVAMYMKRFAMSKHPLLRTARGFISDENHTLQTRGLLVLLISKASRACLKDDWITDQDLVADIYSSQRQLADITETIYTGKRMKAKNVSTWVNLSSFLPNYGCFARKPVRPTEIRLKLKTIRPMIPINETNNIRTRHVNVAY